MLNSILPVKRLSTSDNNQESLRVITFKVMDYVFALPIELVIKIVLCPNINHPLQQGVGIVDLESETIALLDLSYKFANSANQLTTRLEQSRHFLIVAHTKTGEPCGFLVDNAPCLQEIPVSTIRPLPYSYRQVAGLEFVNRIGELNQTSLNQAIEAKVFILG